MGKKVHEIARDMGLTSKDIIEKANGIGIDVSSHLSNVSDEQEIKIRNAFKSSNKSDKTKKVKDEKKNETPVIIRREVIVTEENKKQEVKPKNTTANGVGFVERNKNQDYNIVYRNYCHHRWKGLRR